MELRKGYKQTECGVIPNNWDALPLNKVANEIFLGLTSRVDYVNMGGFPLVRATDIANGKLNFDNAKSISEQQHKMLTKFRRAKRGDVLVSKSGSLGVCVIVDTDKQFSIYESIIVIQSKSFLSNEFLLWLIRDERTQERMLGEKVGSSVPHLNLEMFRKLFLQIPPLIEQTAIANALSDADALISSLEKLIEKKRNIKQGAMQQLLKPKKGWVVKKLGEICEIKKGQLITEATAINGEIPVIAGGKKPSYFHNQANRFNRTITISGSGANAGFVAFFETPIFASDCSTIEENVTYSLKYIFYNLQLLQNKIYKAQTGGAQPHIHPSDLAPFEILFPELNIQNNISEALSDMDAEIETLEKKLSKIKSLKQGMMQELLTGKIRLV